MISIFGQRSITTLSPAASAFAAAKAEAAGLKVVMNRCPKIEIMRLGLPPIASQKEEIPAA